MKDIRILVVEDNKMIAESLADILESLGHKVLGFSESGEGAIYQIGKLNPDLVILDIQLIGKMDGIEVARVLQSDFNIPFVFTTAYADHVTLERAREQGPYGYVVKPYGINDIRAAIEVAMETHKRVEALHKKLEKEPVLELDNLYLKVDSRLVKVRYNDILYIEAKGDYMLFKTENKGYIVHTTIKNLTEKLNPAKFIKVHRSYIVNMEHIEDIEDKSLLIRGKVIPISRPNREKLLKRIHMI